VICWTSRDSGEEMCSCGRFATPAASLGRDCRWYRELHVRREISGGVFVQAQINCRPRAKP
jgi:hypothetical protein